MKQLSVIVPTHNRPLLLREAIASVRRQSVSADEIVAVDDGSQPAVDQSALRAEFGPDITVLRNDKPHGLAWARNQGAQGAAGEIIVQLDDDDLLAPETLAEGAALLQEDPELDLVFLGVEGFGTHAAYFNHVQAEAVRRVLERADGFEIEPGIVQFGTGLMGALLLSVPSAFQHVMARRPVWDRVSGLRRKAYCLDPDIPDEVAAMHAITGPLRDSEWALYAAAVCKKTALINRPRYWARCEGQGQTSRVSQKERHMYQSIDIKSRLLMASRHMPELVPWHGRIKGGLAAMHFNAAYYYFCYGGRLKAWRFLGKALVTRPRLSYARFGVRTLLPRKAPDA